MMGKSMRMEAQKEMVHMRTHLIRHRKMFRFEDDVSASLRPFYELVPGAWPAYPRQLPPAETGGGGGGPFGGGAARMGSVVGVRLVRLVLLELTDRGLMNGREGASIAETGSPR